jgi:hypothetical protein
LTTAADGKEYVTKYYNLDVIISVGYRVKFKQGIRVRIWANKILKEYLIQGYSLDHARLKTLVLFQDAQSKILNQSEAIELL